MLADGIDPVENKRKAKTEDAVNGRTFESVALDWHKNMSARWTPDHSKNVFNRLSNYVFPFIGARAIADLDTYDLREAKRTLGRFFAFRAKDAFSLKTLQINYLQNYQEKIKKLYCDTCLYRLSFSNLF